MLCCKQKQKQKQCVACTEGGPAEAPPEPEPFERDLGGDDFEGDFGDAGAWHTMRHNLLSQWLAQLVKFLSFKSIPSNSCG